LRSRCRQRHDPFLLNNAESMALARLDLFSSEVASFPRRPRIDMLSNKMRFHALALALTLAMFASTTASSDPAITLTHVHGLSYSADGGQLLIPSHHGLAVFSEGRWSRAAGPAHDYMGFSATRDALYSSGHPAPRSGLTNPFGLIKSTDGGRTWQKLGLEGESDFHSLATSHATNTVYVFNPHPNSRMKQPGIYYTENDGLQWKRAAARGLSGELNSLAVHPNDANVVAAGTERGLYLSRDAGETFERLVGDVRVFAETFDLDGEQLWFSTYAGQAGLSRVAFKPGSAAETVPIPSLGEDAVAYIAQNPVHRDEFSIATFKRSVFVSEDRGRSWTQIARDGATLP